MNLSPHQKNSKKNINTINIFIYYRSKIGRLNPFILMTATELNEDTQDQIYDLLEYLQQMEKLKNKDIRILLDKIVRKYGGKVVNK